MAVLGLVGLVVVGVVVGVPFWAVLVGSVLLLATALQGPARRALLLRSRRIGVLMLVTSCVLYVFLDVIPGPSRAVRGDAGEAFRRYADWLGDTLAGDLGFSVGYGESVATGLARTIGPSLQIIAYAQVLALLMAVPAAGWVAWSRGGRVDRVASTAGLLSLSLPVLVVGPLLVVFLALGGPSLFGLQLGLDWFPAGRYTPLGDGLVDHARSLALPSLAMAAGLVGPYFVTLRVLLLETLHEDWVEGAVARGLGPGRIMVQHVMRPVAPVFLSQVATSTTFLAGNLLIVEQIFTIPGVGDYLLVAIGRRDTEAAVGAIFVLAAVLVLVNLVAETVQIAADPSVADAERRATARAGALG